MNVENKLKLIDEINKAINSNVKGIISISSTGGTSLILHVSRDTLWGTMDKFEDYIKRKYNYRIVDRIEHYESIAFRLSMMKMKK